MLEVAAVEDAVLVGQQVVLVGVLRSTGPTVVVAEGRLYDHPRLVRLHLARAVLVWFKEVAAGLQPQAALAVPAQ